MELYGIVFCNYFKNCYVYKKSKLAYWNPTKKCLINENNVENKLVYSNEIMKYGINDINIQIYEIKLEIDDLKKDIRQYNNFISQHSKQGNSTFDRESILSEIEKLKIKEFEDFAFCDSLYKLLAILVFDFNLHSFTTPLFPTNLNDI